MPKISYKAKLKKLADDKLGFDPAIITLIITALGIFSSLCPTTPDPDPVAGVKLNFIQRAVLNDQLKKQARKQGLRWADVKKEAFDGAIRLLGEVKSKADLVGFHNEVLSA